MPGNGFDIKSFTYILEHSWQWVLKIPTHEKLWDIPFYYPYKNTLAFSDALIGIMPLYWLIRIFTKNPFDAIQILMPLMCILNYFCFYYLLKKQLKYSDLSSSIGAFIFAFGIMRYYRMVHLNYYSQYLTILSLIFLTKINVLNSRFKNNIYFLLTVSFLALQIYSCYTLGYCFCLMLGITVFLSLFFRDTRNDIFKIFKDFNLYILIYFIIFIIFLIPFLYHYLSLGQVREMNEVLVYLQNQFCWVRNISFLDNLFFKNIPYIDFYARDEFSASLGIFTTIIAFLGLFKFKKHKKIMFLDLILIFLFSCVVYKIFLWNVIYHLIPGAQGIRAIIRISFIALIIFCIAIAKYIQFFEKNIQKKFFKSILFLIIFLLVFEQIPLNKDKNSAWVNYSWSKSKFEKQINDAIKRIDDKCKIIYFFTVYNEGEKYLKFNEIKKADFNYQVYAQISALGMWSAMKLNKYSSNGFSGLGVEVPYEDNEKYCNINVYVDTEKYNYEKYLNK